MSSSRLDEDQIPVDVQVDDTMIRVRFSGGLELSTPVSRFPRLQQAAPLQRKNWQLSGRGYGIHWPDVDEDISVRGLFQTARKMPESAIEQIPVLISDLMKTTGRLNTLFKEKRFTPDGHLVGSIGEVVAEYIYDLSPTPSSTAQVDGHTKDGRSVQIKLTGEKGTSFDLRWSSQLATKPAEILIALKLSKAGFQEIYNGPFPSHLLEDRRDTSNSQISLTISQLRSLNPKLLPQRYSLDSINRWFTPELSDVA